LEVVKVAQSKYESVVLPNMIRIEGWARDGLSEQQIAKNLNIAYSTFNVYKEKYPEFSEALKRTKEVADREVENSLFKRAMGYEYTETTYERIENMVVEPDGSIKMEPGTKIKTVIKQVAPDVTAQIFWLKNRKPAEWRDKREVNVDGNMTFSVKPAPPPGDDAT